MSDAAESNPELGTIALLHGGSSPEYRNTIAATFDPSQAGPILDQDRPRILVSTDVLVEGHNLQLAEAVVNYDLHWNPQVAVQNGPGASIG